jgi:hypothetical protein
MYVYESMMFMFARHGPVKMSPPPPSPSLLPPLSLPPPLYPPKVQVADTEYMRL